MIIHKSLFRGDHRCQQTPMQAPWNRMHTNLCDSPHFIPPILPSLFFNTSRWRWWHQTYDICTIIRRHFSIAVQCTLDMFYISSKQDFWWLLKFRLGSVCVAEFALHLDQNGTGPFLFCTGNQITWMFTPLRSDSCPISLFALRNRSEGVIHFTLTHAAICKCQNEPVCDSGAMRNPNLHRNGSVSHIALVWTKH